MHNAVVADNHINQEFEVATTDNQQLTQPHSQLQHLICVLHSCLYATAFCCGIMYKHDLEVLTDDHCPLTLLVQAILCMCSVQFIPG